jgi:hypothetical protein
MKYEGGNKMMKYLMIIAVFLGVLLSAFGLFACEMHFSLISPDGKEEHVYPGRETVLSHDVTYTLQVEFVEDHRNCVMKPEDTVYLLDEEKWNTEKDYLALQLVSAGEWEKTSARGWVQELQFTATQEGSVSLEVLRDCPKGGYDENLLFSVQ